MMRTEFYGRYEGVMAGDHPLLGKSYAEFSKHGTGAVKYSYGKLGMPPTETRILTEDEAIEHLRQVVENGYERVSAQAGAGRGAVMDWFGAK
jgi:hypothetical protein